MYINTVMKYELHQGYMFRLLLMAVLQPKYVALI